MVERYEQGEPVVPPFPFPNSAQPAPPCGLQPTPLSYTHTWPTPRGQLTPGIFFFHIFAFLSFFLSFFPQQRESRDFAPADALCTASISGRPR